MNSGVFLAQRGVIILMENAYFAQLVVMIVNIRVAVQHNQFVVDVKLDIFCINKIVSFVILQIVKIVIRPTLVIVVIWDFS